MNTPTIFLLCALSFCAGSKVSGYFYAEQAKKYVEIQRLQVTEKNVAQVNDLLKSHKKDIATGRARFRSSVLGVSLAF